MGERERVFGVPPSSYEVQCCVGLEQMKVRKKEGEGGRGDTFIPFDLLCFCKKVRIRVGNLLCPERAGLT